MVCYVDLFIAFHRNATDDNFCEIVDYSSEVDKFEIFAILHLAMKNSFETLHNFTVVAHYVMEVHIIHKSWVLVN